MTEKRLFRYTKVLVLGNVSLEHTKVKEKIKMERVEGIVLIVRKDKKMIK